MKNSVLLMTVMLVVILLLNGCCVCTSPGLRATYSPPSDESSVDWYNSLVEKNSFQITEDDDGRNGRFIRAIQPEETDIPLYFSFEETPYSLTVEIAKFARRANFSEFDKNMIEHMLKEFINAPFNLKYLELNGGKRVITRDGFDLYEQWKKEQSPEIMSYPVYE